MKTLLLAFIQVAGAGFFRHEGDRRVVSCSIFLHCAPKTGKELQNGENNFWLAGWWCSWLCGTQSCGESGHGGLGFAASPDVAGLVDFAGGVFEDHVREDGGV
jgi:hypothetical protein